MRKTLLACGLCLLMSSCVPEFLKFGKSGDLQARVDSLEQANADYQADVENLQTFITVLSDGLDSIAHQEDMLFNKREGNLDRDQLRKNLQTFEKMLAQQKVRIAHLVDSLGMRGRQIDKLNNLVRHLNEQLDEKNALIQQLRDDLENRNMSIAELNSRVSELTETNVHLSERVETQARELETQDVVINEGYVKIGTKKALKDGGFLTGGFLKKTKVNYQDLPKDKFMKIDIRNFREIPINAKKAKILTQMPASSYEFVPDGDGKTILKVKDPTAFWSVSNFLIIQTD